MIQKVLQPTSKISYLKFAKFCSQIQPISLEVAKQQKKNYCEFSNEQILTLSTLGDQDAKEERLIRNIMSVEKISWDEAQPIFQEMLTINRKNLFLITLPYKLGLFTAVSTGIFTFPMIFHKATVGWFNANFVLGEVPETKDIETVFEIGNWSWAWMEPITGYASFFLLCMQFARNQMQNAQYRPYTGWVRDNRANHIVKKYPKYDPNIVYSWSETDFFNKKDNMNNTL